MGYYDTDVLNLFFPLMIIAFMIIGIEKRKRVYLLYASLFIVLFLFWYHSAKIIVALIVANFLLYCFFGQYIHKLQKQKIIILVIFTLIVIVLYRYSNEIEFFFIRAYEYIFKVKNITFVQENKHTLLFINTLPTVSEAKALAFEKLGTYLSINRYYFYISLVFLGVFYYRYRSFLLTLPLLFLTFLSIKSGIRFTEYGVYIIAFGAVYPLFILKNILYKLKLKQAVIQLLFLFMSLLLISLYLQKIIEKNKFLHPIFKSQSVTMLKELDKELKMGDYIVTWWDYGWPLWYYTKAYTLIDNAKHFEDNYLVSKMLFSEQSYTAKASRYFLDSCYTRRCYISKRLFRENTPSTVDRAIVKSKIEERTKGIYFLFHSRMVKIMRTILNFSLVDPESGKKSKDKILTVMKIKKIKDKIVSVYSNDLKLDLRKKLFNVRNKYYLLKDIYFVNQNVIKIKSSYKKAYLHAIIYQHKYLIICNDKVFNSFFIQAFLLNNYDKRYFEMFKQSKDMKILRLK